MEVTQFVRFCLARGVPQSRIRSSLAELGIPFERVERSIGRAAAIAVESSIELVTQSSTRRPRAPARPRPLSRVELQTHPGLAAIQRNRRALERTQKQRTRARSQHDRAFWFGIGVILLVLLLKLS